MVLWIYQSHVMNKFRKRKKTIYRGGGTNDHSMRKRKVCFLTCSNRHLKMEMPYTDGIPLVGIDTHLLERYWCYLSCGMVSTMDHYSRTHIQACNKNRASSTTFQSLRRCRELYRFTVKNMYLMRYGSMLSDLNRNAG